MTLKETRTLESAKVRSLCIRNQYYTCGTNAEYTAMFEAVEAGCSILTIATDILEHSNISKLQQQSGCDYVELLECICFELINDCCITTVHIEK